MLASPLTVTELGGGAVTLITQGPVAPVSVLIADTLSKHAGWPADRAFLVPPAALRSATMPRTPIPINELLLTGAGRVIGREVTVMAERERMRLRRETVAYIFQSFGLPPMRSATDNVVVRCASPLSLCANARSRSRSCCRFSEDGTIQTS